MAGPLCCSAEFCVWAGGLGPVPISGIPPTHPLIISKSIAAFDLWLWPVECPFKWPVHSTEWLSLNRTWYISYIAIAYLYLCQWRFWSEVFSLEILRKLLENVSNCSQTMIVIGHLKWYRIMTTSQTAIRVQDREPNSLISVIKLGFRMYQLSPTAPNFKSPLLFSCVFCVCLPTFRTCPIVERLLDQSATPSGYSIGLQISISANSI